MVGMGIADWQLLVARPLGMAPREPLDDTETMQIKRMRGENANTDRWHGGPARETLLGNTAPEPLCCAPIYIVKISTYLQSRLPVYKQKG